jgi:hypothetical protein
MPSVDPQGLTDSVGEVEASTSLADRLEDAGETLQDGGSSAPDPVSCGLL